MSPKQIDKNINKLINKGLITVIKTGDKLEYTITNKIMHNILYQMVPPKNKMLQHKNKSNSSKGTRY